MNKAGRKFFCGFPSIVSKAQHDGQLTTAAAQSDTCYMLTFAATCFEIRRKLSAGFVHAPRPLIR